MSHLRPEARDQLQQKAKVLADVFQCSSSNVEGQNGYLSLRNHQLRGLGLPRKRECLTAIHNFFLNLLHEALAHVLPGRFNAVNPAAVDLHCSLDLLQDTPVTIALSPDTDSEHHYRPESESLRGDDPLSGEKCETGSPQARCPSKTRSLGTQANLPTL